MLKVHLSNGETKRFDLSSEEDAKRWLESAGDPSFQARVTGLTIKHNGISFSLPRPDGFDTKTISLFAEHAKPNGRDKGGERIICRAADIDVSVKIHNEQKAARVNVRRLYRAR